MEYIFMYSSLLIKFVWSLDSSLQIVLKSKIIRILFKSKIKEFDLLFIMCCGSNFK